MSEPSPRQQRLTLIDSIETGIVQLLTMDRGDRTRDDLCLASHDLTDARLLLARDDAERVPSVLRCADLTLEIATRRVAAVAAALKTRGLDTIAS